MISKKIGLTEFQQNLKLKLNRQNILPAEKKDVLVRIVKEKEGTTNMKEQIVSEMEHYINVIMPDINFKYPTNYFVYDNSEILKKSGWQFPKGKNYLKEELDYLKLHFNEMKLIPFAMDAEATKYACFIIDGKNNNRIKVVYPFGNKETFYQKEYENINDWIKNGIQ